MKCHKCGTVHTSNEGNNYCSVCGNILASTEDLSYYIDWNDANDTGLLVAFAKTTKKILFHPAVFFRNFKESNSLFNPIMYALLATAIGSLADLIWHIFIPQNNLYSSMEFQSIASKTVAYTPVLLLIHTIFMSIYIFIVTSITGIKKHNFKTIFSGVCYSQAVAILTIIPYIGTVILPVWSMVITIIMVARMHKISNLRAFMTLLLPVIILVILIFIPIMIFMGGLLFSAGSILKFYQ